MFSSNRGLLYGQETPTAKVPPSPSSHSLFVTFYLYFCYKIFLEIDCLHYEHAPLDRSSRKKGTQIHNFTMFSSNRGLLYGQETPTAKVPPLLVFLLHHHFLFHCFSRILFILLFFVFWYPFNYCYVIFKCCFLHIYCCCCCFCCYCCCCCRCCM